ncbi:MAG: HEAT repeat domain-containing protein [Chloroflexi bacterium]|nr:HEAT repeat domain-containing protein [Chloroflexota bacterium]
MTQDGSDQHPEPDERPVIPPATTVLDEIERGAPLESSRLRALSEPDDSTLQRMLGIWPRIVPERRRELLAALERLGEEDVTLDFHRIALTALRDDDPATRILAVRGLQQEDRPEYMQILLSQLRSDPEPSVRAEIAEVLTHFVVVAELGMMPEEDAETLSATLRDVVDDIEEPDEVRGRALEALGTLSDEAIAELISEQYEIGSHRMRVAALRAMGRSASEGWLEVLIYHFDDEDAEIRAVCAEAAGQLLVDEAVPPLIMLAQEDADDDVQVAAIRALGEIANDEAEHVLSRWLSERRDPHIQEAIREALAEVQLLTGEFVDEARSGPDFGSNGLGFEEGDEDDEDRQN